MIEISFTSVCTKAMKWLSLFFGQKSPNQKRVWNFVSCINSYQLQHPQIIEVLQWKNQVRRTKLKGCVNLIHTKIRWLVWISKLNRPMTRRIIPIFVRGQRHHPKGLRDESDHTAWIHHFYRGSGEEMPLYESSPIPLGWCVRHFLDMFGMYWKGYYRDVGEMWYKLLSVS